MAQLQYIGARYVPKFYENSLNPSSMDWESGVGYEPLTVVTYNSDTYTSKVPIPSTVGAPDVNPTYWAKTADYNAALVALQNAVSILQNDIASYKDAYINALDIGFKNDGATDNLVKFNEIFNGVDYEYKTIYFPAGVYLINGTINATRLVKCVGDPGTVFKEGISTNYIFIGDYSVNYTYWNKRRANYFVGITFDCDSKSSGIALNEYMDFGMFDCDINNATVYGINLRDVMFVNNKGCQFSGINLRFYGAEIANTIAIYDNSFDSQYIDIVVVDYCVAFEGVGMVDTLHHWLSKYSLFSNSATLKVDAGTFTNIYSDTAEAAYTPHSSNAEYIARCTTINGLIVANNLTVNPSNTVYVAKFGAYPAANLILNGIDNRSGLCVFSDVKPTSTKITGLSTGNVDFGGSDGQILSAIRSMQKSEDNSSIDNMFNTGWYKSGNITDLPSTDASMIFIISRAANDALQIVIESGNPNNSPYIYYRFAYFNGSITTGTWKKIATANI